jgi:cytochrome c biogenesis protein CcdA/thiol-disulfide isomerase/thioredoxin
VLLLVLFAFVAGAGTALSPCVLPVLPAILSAGVTGGRRRPLGIVTGLALSFTFATVALVYVIEALGLPDDFTRKLAIAVLFGFGVLLLVPPLSDRVEAWISRIVPAPTRAGREGFGGGLVVGASLGFVYAPCAGPILAGVITVSASQTFTFGRLAVAFAYAIGSAAVLYVMMLGGRRISDRLRAHRGQVQMVMGVVMIAVAVVMATNLDVTFENSIAHDLPSALVDPTSRIESSSDITSSLANVRGGGPVSQETGGAEAAAGERLPNKGPAPEFTGNQMWFNTPGDKPLTLAGLRGKVVLVDFWTYTCINCIRTLPYLESWYRQYHKDGLEIVGVHSPEFPFEKEASNVQNAINQFGITYPVAQDNDLATWNAYHNQYWPADYLIDANGDIRLVHFGEGGYADAEKAIRDLLAVSGHAPKQAGVSGHVSAQKAAQGLATPESYLGGARAQGFVNPLRPGTSTYPAVSPQSLGPNQLAYSGEWTISGEDATAGKDATLSLNFKARRVFLVTGSPGQPRPIQVELDGKPIAASESGADVKNGTATIGRQRLYRLVDLPNAQAHVLTLHFAPGINGYSFTFG